MVRNWMVVVAVVVTACGQKDEDASTGEVESEARSSSACPGGTVDMLDWMTLDPDLRTNQRMVASSNPLYTQVDADRFWWMKTPQGDTWDINTYDADYIYFDTTEEAWHAPWSCKPAVDRQRWRAARRCVKVGDPTSARINNTSSLFQIVSGGEVQVTSGDQDTWFEVRDGKRMAWGSLGTLPTLVLDYHWDCHSGACTRLEQYFLTQRYGLVQWRYSVNGVVSAQTTFDRIEAATVPTPMFACTSPATYRQASLSANGDATGGSSVWPSIDDTGRFIAYSSIAWNLVPGDTNNTWDIFVYDDYWQVTSQRASVASDGTEANGPSSTPAISRNGEARWIAFASDATNLVAGDTNNATDIFVHDRWLGTTELVSVGANGQGNGASTAPSISADGCKIAFESTADNLVAGDTNGWPDVFVRDRCAGTTVRVSVTASGGEARMGGVQASIDDSGRFVAFTSGSDDIVAGDDPQNGQGYMDVFVYDGYWGVTTARASLTSAGVAANDHSYYPRISGNGRYVAFVSNATNLAAGDSNGQPDVFVRDLWLDSTAPVSVGGPSTGGYTPSITADGRFVGFVTTASPTPGAPLAWTTAVRDQQAGDTVLPRALDGSIPSSSSTGGVAIQSHVRSVAGLDVTDRISLAFESTSTNITPRPDNAGTDIFTRTISVP